MSTNGHRHSASVSQTQNHKAQLANAYNELGKELSSQKIRVVGNYTLGKVIGEGTYGKVRLGVHRLSGTRVAIKQIPKAMSASLTREIHHHRQLHHPHVTQLYEVIATESNIWLVTELCSGGELFDYLAEKGRLSENETRVIFGQLCLAVAYVHSKGIVHRDLKLENVLLDEHCRVKLGDFGFTREFERGSLLETFCGTTGYASPEMLLAQKYLGPEVDIWSLGIILYTLLTGTLPFDDDDEGIMKEKVVKGIFEDPEWLSDDARHLIKNVLQTDPVKRPTIAQILAHSWFTTHSGLPVISRSGSLASRPTSPTPLRPPSSTPDSQPHSALSGTSDSTFHSASSEFPTSTPTTTPDNASSYDVFQSARQDGDHVEITRNPSDATMKDVVPESVGTGSGRRSTVVEEDVSADVQQSPDKKPSRSSVSRNESNLNYSSKAPPAYPARTPARTKRRSVSSTLSEVGPSTPTFEKSAPPSPPQDFSSILATPAPIIFSTPLERDLLNRMSNLGLDTGQIVHSVLSDACDATGALWWMLKRKAEKKALDGGSDDAAQEGAEAREEVKQNDSPKQDERKDSKCASAGRSSRDVKAPIPPPLLGARSAPELQFIPPTPTVASTIRPATPPRAKSPNNPLLSPTSSVAETAIRSHPSTPGGSLKDRDRDSNGSKGRKTRSGSVSIMQRANTVLEAAGLVRKKSSEAVKEEKERERERASEKRVGSNDEPRVSHGSGSSKLAKSPPLKASRDISMPTTPPSSMDFHHTQAQVGSPWIMAGTKQSPPSTAAESPRDTLAALPEISSTKVSSGHRSRASLLSAFRMWFREDHKGKRREDPPQQSHTYTHALNSPGLSPASAQNRGTVKRRTSGTRGRFTAGRKTGHRAKRSSVSSRRSSSVNSRRSSIHSAQFTMLESPVIPSDKGAGPSRKRSDASRRSFGSHTPNSEREDYVSRPSSIQSFYNQRHRKSPSASSAGSMYLGRTASPLPSKYHRRGASGSSTRVLRQIQPAPGPSHLRSNSASSAHSLTSSRQGSVYDLSESDSRRNSSPNKPHRRSLEETPRRNHSSTTFVAHKRQTPFANPSGSSGYLNSLGRSSWKKSWGMEPPGWQTRSAYSAIEVLAISPPVDVPLGIRDVFSGRRSLSMGDESDWVDEDDDSPAYAGGLGQMPITASSVGSTYSQPLDSPVLSPPPRATAGRAATGKRAAASTTLAPVSVSGRGTRGKAGRSPVGRSSPLPSENSFEPSDARGGRRQLPAGRSGPAFRQAIQEEDEGEEE
ncbi:hypothetical protein AcV7_005275 [Taiwanofungus camphoratus]|nr:hypothetical protein AcV7_005275 [Antrodia cinnamomea]